MRRAWLAVPFLCLLAAAAAAQRDRPLRVVIYDAPGVAPSALETALAAFTEAGFDARRMTPDEVRAGALDDADVALFTGGRGSLQGRLLGDDGRARVRRFVRDGHGYLGICAGAYLAIQGPEEFFKVGIVAAHNATGDRWIRGIVPTPVVPNDGSPPVTLHYANGPLLAPEAVEGLAPYVALATFDADVYQERFDTHPGEMPGAPAVAAARYGEGRIVLFSPNPTLDPGHPELLVRAARWVARGGPVRPDLRWRDVFGAVSR